MNIFAPLDAFLAVWQTLLVLLVHNPWMAIVPALFVGINEAIKAHDKKKYPND